MNEVLFSLCRHAVSVMDGWIPYPSTVIAHVCGKSLYQTRKELNGLKAAGYVVSDRYIHIDPEEERPLIINGYTITERTKKTEEYRKAYEEERAICKDVFGIDIGACDTLTLLEE